jgi:hypothetical protein
VCSRAEEYRSRAHALVNMALRATNPTLRFELMETARQWHVLAEDVEQIAAIREEVGDEPREPTTVWR